MAPGVPVAVATVVAVPEVQVAVADAAAMAEVTVTVAPVHLRLQSTFGLDLRALRRERGRRDRCKKRGGRDGNSCQGQLRNHLQLSIVVVSFIRANAPDARNLARAA
jgi:hypothetical protein